MNDVAESDNSDLFRINKKTFLLSSCEFIDSPNQDDRPKECKPEIIVIHGISLPPGVFGGNYIRNLFLNTLDQNKHHYFKKIGQMRVSAHLLINRKGVITQFVPFDKRAWHAGKSEFKGKNNCNDFSIGIELEGEDCTIYEDMQYIKLAKTLNALFNLYPHITPRDVVAHSDIAPLRKTDPGPAFDWCKLYDHLIEDKLR